MSSFIGGSAFGMASQIAEGYLLLNHTHLKKLNKGELASLQHEIGRVLTAATSRPSTTSRPSSCAIARSVGSPAPRPWSSTG